MSFTSYRIWFFGLIANAAGKCGQRNGCGKLPVGVISLDNPYGSYGIRPLSRCGGGVQEIEFCSEGLRQAVPKLKQGEIAALLDPTSERLELRAGSSLEAENAIDAGVRDGGLTALGWEKLPEMAGDVPVRYALTSPCPGPVPSHG